jgi:outer membrane cobalamin receptor
MRASLSRWLLLAPFALGLPGACRTFHPTRVAPHNDGDRILITEGMIARSGGQNAWEVLKREAPQLTYREDRNGQPAHLGRRGRSSLVLHEAPKLFVDGVEVADLRSLQQIPASTLLSIEILNGLDGTMYYGTNASTGVILVHTKNGSEP